MNGFRYFFTVILDFAVILAILAIALACVLDVRRATAQEAPLEPEAAVEAERGNFEQAQVLERGPVHEAFAEPFAAPAGDDAIAVIAARPPEPVDEVPPEIRPEGDNVHWIPGYWMWSVDRKDFVWVSGIWRQFPPKRQWIAGYWEDVEGGFRWISGYWAAAGAAEPQFLPEPPVTLEVGPNQPPPAANHFWIPGCWTWRDASYAWRPGYWYLGQANWIWIPHRYVYTPHGYVFVAGYWDYPIHRRGFLFAPVYWRRPLVAWRHLRYIPRHIINVGGLLGNLFVHPHHNHYYYGHFDPLLRRQHGLHAWFELNFHGRGGGLRSYDPLLAYHSWIHAGRNHHWLGDFQRDFHQRHRADVNNRTNRTTLSAQAQGRDNIDLVQSVKTFSADGRLTTKVRRLSPEQIEQARKDAERRVANVRGRDERGSATDLSAGAQATTRAKATLRSNGRPAGDAQAKSRASAGRDLPTQQQNRTRLEAQQRQLDARLQAGARTNPPLGSNAGRPEAAAPAAEKAQRSPSWQQRFRAAPATDGRTLQTAPTFRSTGPRPALERTPSVQPFGPRSTGERYAPPAQTFNRTQPLTRGPQPTQRFSPPSRAAVPSGQVQQFQRNAPAARPSIQRNRSGPPSRGGSGGPALRGGGGGGGPALRGGRGGRGPARRGGGRGR